MAVVQRERETAAYSSVGAEGFFREVPQHALQRQWDVFAELVRRELVASKDTRSLATAFAAVSVNESLPKMFVNSFFHRPEWKSGAYLGRTKLPAYLEIPPVSDDRMLPDLRGAPLRVTAEQLLGMTAMDDMGSFYYPDMYSGITDEEKSMVAQRYTFARDVKRLALTAEMLDNDKPPVLTNGMIVYNLASGIRFAVDQGVQGVEDLCNPLAWEKRKQIKDRVYEIHVAGRKYLLKERKTPRHLHTRGTPYEDGLSSQMEYETSKFFNENCTVSFDNTRVSWEKPVAYCVYPDGFQFAIFAYEEELLSGIEAAERLAEGIRNNREAFDGEFEEIAERVAFLWRDPRVVNRMVRLFERVRPETLFPLTFDEFTHVKAWSLLVEAHNGLADQLTDHGYDNTDGDGYAFRVKEGVFVEIVGFDFECFRVMSAEDLQARNSRVESFRAQQKKGIALAGWWDGKKVTRMERAAYCAILDRNDHQRYSPRAPQGSY